MSDTAIDYAQDGRIGHVRIDDGNRNVLTPALVGRLKEIVTTAADDPDVTTLIIQGNDKALSVGLDTATVTGGGDAAQALLADMREILTTLYLSRLRSIVIARGHAAAAGAMLLLVADHRIGIAGAGRIGLSEVRVGLTVPALTQQLIRDRIVPSAQYAATTLAMLYDYPDARAIGYIDRLVDDHQSALDAAKGMAAGFDTLNETAYLETKHGMRAAFAALI